MTEKLLDCPFCGNTDQNPDFYMKVFIESYYTFYFGECPRCQARGGNSKDKEIAIKLWNTRAENKDDL